MAELSGELETRRKETLIKKAVLDELQRKHAILQEKKNAEEKELKKLTAEREPLDKKNEVQTVTRKQETKLIKSIEAELNEQRKIAKDLDEAENKLAEEWSQFRDDLEHCKRKKEEMQRKCQYEERELTGLKREWELYQKEIEKSCVELGNAKLTRLFFESKNAALEQEAKEIVDKERMLEEHRKLQAQQWNTLENINRQKTEVEKGEAEYQTSIKQVLAQVSTNEDYKLKLEEKLTSAKTHLSILREKNMSVLCRLFS